MSFPHHHLPLFPVKGDVYIGPWPNNPKSFIWKLRSRAPPKTRRLVVTLYRSFPVPDKVSKMAAYPDNLKKGDDGRLYLKTAVANHCWYFDLGVLADTVIDVIKKK